MELPIKFPCGARNSVCLFVNSWGFCCEGLHVPESMFLGVIRPGDVFFFTGASESQISGTKRPILLFFRHIFGYNAKLVDPNLSKKFTDIVFHALYKMAYSEIRYLEFKKIKKMKMSVFGVIFFIKHVGNAIRACSHEAPHFPDRIATQRSILLGFSMLNCRPRPWARRQF